MRFICWDGVPEEVGVDTIQGTSREFGLQFKQRYFFHYDRGKAKYRILRPLRSAVAQTI